MNFENQKQEVKKVVNQLSDKLKNAAMKLNKGSYSKSILKVVIPSVVIGALTIGTMAIASKNEDKQQEKGKQINAPTSTSQSISIPTSNSSTNSIVTSSVVQVEPGLTVPPILPENMPAHYDILLELDGHPTPLDFYYSLSNLEKPDDTTCIYGYDKSINQYVFYITNSYYAMATTTDFLSGKEVIASNLVIIEEFELRELIMSDLVEAIKNHRSKISDGNINKDFWEDRYKSEAFYDFANKLSAAHGNGDVYQDPIFMGKEQSTPQELPVIGTFSRKSSDITDQFTVVEVHLWTISPEFQPDELIVKVVDENGVICESIYNYNERNPEAEMTFVYGYDDSIGQCTVTVVPTVNLTDDEATDFLTGNIVNSNLLTEKATISLDALALTAYGNSMIDQGQATGDKAESVAISDFIISSDGKPRIVIIEKEAIQQYAQSISDLFSMPPVYISVPEKNAVLTKK